jgi:hypothetical protein
MNASHSGNGITFIDNDLSVLSWNSLKGYAVKIIIQDTENRNYGF